MRGKLLNLFALISSFVFSLQIFIGLAPAFKGTGAFETRVVKGITGNAVFYGFNKPYEVFVYYSALLVVPALAVSAWFLLFRYPVMKLSALRPGRTALVRTLLALPFTIWLLSIPAMNQYDSGLVLRTAVFFLLLASAVYLSVKWDIDKRRPAGIFVVTYALSITAVVFSNPWSAGLLFISISLGLLTSIFWLYQSGGVELRHRKYAAILLFLSIVSLSAGTAFTGKVHEAFLGAFIFMAVPAACYAFYGARGREAFRRLSRRGLLYDAAFLYYGFVLGAFLFESILAASALMPVSFILSRLAVRHISDRDNVSSREAARVTAFGLSPVALLLLKNPLYMLLYGRYSGGPDLLFSVVLFIAALVLCSFLFKRQGAMAVLLRTRWFPLIPISIIVYASLFNPVLDGAFDYYHEAENVAYAHLFLKGFGFSELYLIEHGLIQDLGLGLAAAWSFGATLEGLRNFLMYVGPLAAISVLVLCFSIFEKRYVALIVFLVTAASMLSFPVRETPYPMLDKNFLRIAAPCLSLALFAAYVRSNRTALLFLSSGVAFAGVLWSIDTGVFFAAALSSAALMLDFNRHGLDIKGYRAFPAHAVTLALLSALLYLAAPDLFSAYADVVTRQGAVVQANAHARLYPDFASHNVKTIFVAFVNPAIIIFSFAVFAWLLLTRRAEEKDTVFLALLLFVAAFFTRAVHRSDISHLIYASALSPVLLAMTALRLAEASSGSRFGQKLPIVMASYALFAVFPYNLFEETFFPFKVFRSLGFERPAQALSTEKIGSVKIDEHQAQEINAFTDFYEKEAKGKGLFDFTNNYGITLWLLDAEPLTRSLFIAHENTAEEQAFVVKRLEERKPGFILFNSNDKLSMFDGINNSVRHPIVSAYLFKNYRPYARVLDNYILARGDRSPSVQGSKRLFAIKGERGEVQKGFKGIEISVPEEVNIHGRRYISLLMSVEAKGEDYETKGIMLKNPVRVASIAIESGASSLGYQFKLKNSGEPVRYNLPLPDGRIDRLIFTPANFPASFEIKEFGIYSASLSQYPRTLSDWDMFEIEELGLMPYYLARERKVEGSPALDYEFDGQGPAEITGLDLDAKGTTHFVIEASGKEGAKAALYWDTGKGFFKDQAAYFKLKDGKNRYFIDLTCLPSWQFSTGHIKRLKIAAVNETTGADIGFSPARLSVFSSK